jgi:hypothetical protein
MGYETTVGWHPGCVDGVGSERNAAALRHEQHSVEDRGRVMTVRTIAQESWYAELDSFSRQHEGWLVSVKTRGLDGRVAIEARDLPLQGVSRGAPDSSDISILVGDQRTHLSHDVRDPVSVKVELTANQAERALIIDSRDGTTTTVEFRSPMRPDEVDGLPSVDHG